MTGQIRLCKNGCNKPCAPRYLVCQTCRHGPKNPCPTCGKPKTPAAQICAVCARTNPRKGSQHAAWKGGRIIDLDGYVRVYAPHDSRANCGRYMKEHILVMEASLGRQLLKGETVHHKNGIRSDNRLENLELFIKHPPGQRVPDLVIWAEECLRRYAPEKLK